MFTQHISSSQVSVNDSSLLQISHSLKHGYNTVQWQLVGNRVYKT